MAIFHPTGDSPEIVTYALMHYIINEVFSGLNEPLTEAGVLTLYARCIAAVRNPKYLPRNTHWVRALANVISLANAPDARADIRRIVTPEDLVRKGRDIERRVLARAVRHQLEDRVILNGKKTVVFTD